MKLIDVTTKFKTDNHCLNYIEQYLTPRKPLNGEPIGKQQEELVVLGMRQRGGPFAADLSIKGKKAKKGKSVLASIPSLIGNKIGGIDPLTPLLHIGKVA